MMAGAAGLHPPGTAKMPHRLPRPPCAMSEDHLLPQPAGMSATQPRQPAAPCIATFPGGPGGASHMRAAAAVTATGGTAPPSSLHVAPQDAVGKADHVFPRQLQGGGGGALSHTGSEVSSGGVFGVRLYLLGLFVGVAVRATPTNVPWRCRRRSRPSTARTSLQQVGWR
jgi:hypothetical protein